LKRSHEEAHPEEYLEAGRKYREAHREEINAKARTRRSAALEHYRQIGRESRARHQEERNAYQRAYNKANPDKIVAANNRRRAREYRAEGSHAIEEWEELKAQHAYTCLCCGKSEPEIELTRDHVIPLEQGGSDWISNIQPLCATCNSKKSTKYIDYRP
jgi:5-methylcytosine-specific restriction endonuclease McrA